MKNINDNMFTYRELRINSATPINEIERYLDEIGASRNMKGAYVLADIKIWVEQCEYGSFAGFAIPRHEIRVTGERAEAEKFLTEFRLRFLRLGG